MSESKYQYQDDSHKQNIFAASDLIETPEEEESVCSFVLLEDKNDPDGFRIEEFSDLTDDYKTITAALSGKEELQKNFENSKQSESELDQPSITNTNVDPEWPLIEPPYDPDCFARFLNCSEINAACIDRKVVDSVYRTYQILPKYPVRKDDEEGKGRDQDIHGNFVTEEDFIKDCMEITNFIANVDDCEDFEEITKKVAMDYEAIGWGAYEVNRNINGKISI